MTHDPRALADSDLRSPPDLRARPSVTGTRTWASLAAGNLATFENIPQRVPIVLAAAFIAASAIATGRCWSSERSGLEAWLGRWERLAVGFGLGTTGLGLATLILGRLGLLNPWLIRVGLVVPILVELGWAILHFTIGGPSRTAPSGPGRQVAGPSWDSRRSPGRSS